SGMQRRFERRIGCEHALGPFEHAVEIGARNHDNAGIVAYDEISWLHCDPADRHRLAERLELEAPLARGRRDGAPRPPWVGRADLLDIAAPAVDHHGRRATLSRRKRSKAAECRDVGAADVRHQDVSRPDRSDHLANAEVGAREAAERTGAFARGYGKSGKTSVAAALCEAAHDARNATLIKRIRPGAGADRLAAPEKLVRLHRDPPVLAAEASTPRTKPPRDAHASMAAIACVRPQQTYDRARQKMAARRQKAPFGRSGVDFYRSRSWSQQ